MPPKNINGARMFFISGQQENVSYCQIGGCSRDEAKIKGDHLSNMRRHLERFHKGEAAVLKEAEQMKVAAKRKECPSFSASNPKRPKVVSSLNLTETELMNALVELVTINGRPFSLMEDDGFRRILNLVLNALGTPLKVNAENIRVEVEKRSRDIRESIKSEVKGRMVSVKIDHVTRLDRSFLGINIQFVKDKKIELRTLGVKETTSRHTAFNIRNDCLEILGEFRIKPQDLYSITTDNASNMLAAVRLLNAGEEASEDALGPAPSAAALSLLDEQEEDNPDAAVFDEGEGDSLEVEDLQVSFLVKDTRRTQIESISCAPHTLQLAVHDVVKKRENQALLKTTREYAKTLRKPTMAPVLKERGMGRPP